MSLTAFSQTTSSNPATSEQFINLTQTDSASAVKHLQELVKKGEVMAFVDSNGFLMFQAESVLESCYNDWTPKEGSNQGKRMTSLRRNCAAQKNSSGTARPLMNFTTSTGLSGQFWGGFSLNIPVDPKS